MKEFKRGYRKMLEFKEEFREDLQVLLGQYFRPPPSGPPTNGVKDKGKGVLGAPPGFLPKNTELPQAPIDLKLVDTSSVHQTNQACISEMSAKTHRLECLRKIDVLLSYSARKSTPSMTSSPRSLPKPFIISGYSSTPTSVVSVSQSVSSVPGNKSGSRSISPALMTERKEKGLCFWYGAKYHVKHKCVKSQLYQFLLEALSDIGAEEFQECSDKLEESGFKKESTKSPMISLHALTGL
ncbi:hypothetical protein J1N35_013230 [Gossypium stocksii]|uniref:Uncharacterized protein n=1 Tax=Gossypium stocksii TaxID=47602 RepID=A0A9D3VTR5_9ROSI|nr:hypothetical protein J1N35_013230 [Gossypium stocksii]